MSQPKLIKGRKYVITGSADDHESARLCRYHKVKFPQAVVWNGEYFLVKDARGDDKEWLCSYFTYKHNSKPAKVELRKNRKGHYFTVKSANGKVLNHSFNSKRGCLNGIEALRRAMVDFEILDMTNP